MISLLADAPLSKIKKNPDKFRAQKKLQRAVVSGRIIRGCCEVMRRTGRKAITMTIPNRWMFDGYAGNIMRHTIVN